MILPTADLFDKIEDNDVYIHPQITVDKNRIQKLTLQRIKNNTVTETASKNVSRSVKRIILIAAILSCFFALTCYAVAATLDATDFFKFFFSSRQENTLSNGQNEYIENRTATIGESVTQDEVTVTVKGAISDGTTAYILVEILSQENLKIDSLPLAFDVEFKSLKLEGQEDDHISSVSSSFIPLSDSDGRKNTASMLIQYNVYQLNGSNFSLTDGRKRTLQLRNLFYHEKEPPYSLCTVAEGLWEYEFAFTAVDNKEVELLTAPLSASYSQISGNQVDATIFSIRMNWLSCSIYYTIDCNEVQEAGDFGILKFLMKDGSVIYAFPEKAGQTSQIENGCLIPSTNSHYCTYSFDSPIKFEDVAAVCVGTATVYIDSLCDPAS